MNLLAMSLLLFADSAAITRALDYLSREVPAWKQENGCYSCHNNGDAARALMAGGRQTAIADTLAWLAKPEAWDHQQAAAEFRDTKLARVQFALALTEAYERKLVTDREALMRAARMVAEIVPLEQDGNIGSPATYGTALASAAAIRVLRAAGLSTDKPAAYLRELKPRNTPDLAAQVMASFAAPARLLETRNPDGAWGPHRGTPSEVFDTAIAVIALCGGAERPDAAIRQATAWLTAQQLDNGGWPGTTRPAGGVSYAQHISTSGWATLALLTASAP
jgi:hypothetical protein